MSRSSVLVLCLMAASLGCSAPASTSTESTGDRPHAEPVASGAGGGGPVVVAGHMDGPFYREEGAPDPRHCSIDTECLGDTVTVANGCCVEDSTPIPQTWAYHTWLSTHRMTPACQSLRCPILPPQMPPECAFQMRCVEGLCQNSCP